MTTLPNGGLFILPGVAHDVPELTEAKLIAIDAFLRVCGKNANRAHVLGFFVEDQTLRDVTGWDGTPRAGWSNRLKRWNWKTLKVDKTSKIKVDVAFCRKQPGRPAAMFGLIVHELSHLAYSEDGPGDVLGTASNWEWLAGRAYNKQPLSGSTEERRRQSVLMDIVW